VQWQGRYRCGACTQFRSRFGVENWPTCKPQRLCDLLDVSLIDHLGKRPLEDYAVAMEQIEYGALVVGILIQRKLEPFPANEAEFIDTLQHWHFILFKEAVPAIAGTLRSTGVAFGGDGANAMRGHAPPTITDSLCRLYRVTMWDAFGSPDARVVSIACARFLEAFFAIHPFADGNGRVGRWMMRYALLNGGQFDVPSLTSEEWKSTKERRRYVHALEYAHRHAPGSDNANQRPHTAHHKYLAEWIEERLVKRTADDLDEAPPPET
jgi:fido (protein-threonine AMPylation protein)